jgi:hypothetical protein
MGAPARLSQGRSNVDGLQLRATGLLIVMRNRVRNYQPRKIAFVDNLARAPGKDSMGDDSEHLLRSMLLESLRSLRESAARIRHVIDQDRDLVFHVSDKNHSADFVRAGALLVDQSEVQVETVGDGGGAERGVSNAKSWRRGKSVIYRLAPPASGDTMTAFR